MKLVLSRISEIASDSSVSLAFRSEVSILKPDIGISGDNDFGSYFTNVSDRLADKLINSASRDVIPSSDVIIPSLDVTTSCDVIGELTSMSGLHLVVGRESWTFSMYFWRFSLASVVWLRLFSSISP